MTIKQNIILLTLILFSQINFSQNKVKLELNLHEGDEYIATTKLHSTSEQKVNGETQIVKKEIENKYKLKILNSKSDSSFYIKLTYLKFNNTFHFNDEIIIFDSDSIETQNFQQQDSSFLNIGKSFNFCISKYGKILLIDSITFIKSEKSNKENLKKTLETFFIPLPKKSITKNDFWFYSDTINEDILNIHDKKYTFTNSTNNTFIINNIAKISSDKTKFKKARDLFIFYNIKGTEKGIIILDKKTCMINEKNIIQSSSGKSEVKYSKNSGSVFSSPLKIEYIYSIKTKKIK